MFFAYNPIITGTMFFEHFKKKYMKIMRYFLQRVWNISTRKKPSPERGSSSLIFWNIIFFKFIEIIIYKNYKIKKYI